MKNILLLFIIFISQTFADKKIDKYKHKENIKIILTDYFNNVDKKNVEGISDHFTSELIMHFGSDEVTHINTITDFHPIFESWSN